MGGAFFARFEIGAAPAAGLADESQIGQPDVIGPAICIDLDMVRTAVVRAINQESARAVG